MAFNALISVPFADAVPVHPFPAEIHPVVGVPADGASDFSLEAVRNRCLVPCLVQPQVLPDLCAAVGKTELPYLISEYLPIIGSWQSEM